MRFALVCILFLKKKKKKKEGEDECKSHIDMNEDLNVISNIWWFVFLKKGLINGLFAQCKLFWLINKFAHDIVIILVAVVVKSLEWKAVDASSNPVYALLNFYFLKSFLLVSLFLKTYFCLNEE